MSDTKINASEIEIRKADLIDVPFVGGLIFKLMGETSGRLPSGEEQKGILSYMMRAWLTGKSTAVIAVVKETERVVGVVVFEVKYADYTGKPTIVGRHLYVDKAYRRQGIAKKLINYVEDEAVKAGFTEAYIETPIPKFFEQFGFKKDKVIMRKVREGE